MLVGSKRWNLSLLRAFGVEASLEGNKDGRLCLLWWFQSLLWSYHDHTALSPYYVAPSDCERNAVRSWEGRQTTR